MKQASLIIALTTLSAFGWGCAKPETAPTPPAIQEKNEQGMPEAVPTEKEPAATNTQAGTQNTPKQNPAIAPKPTAKPAPKPTAVKPAYQVVNINSGNFAPQVIAIFEGDGITWVNKDSIAHNTRSDNALLWDSGSIAPGGKYSHVFPSSGTYAYSDGNTGKLKGTVVVNKRPQ